MVLSIFLLDEYFKSDHAIKKVYCKLFFINIQIVTFVIFVDVIHLCATFCTCNFHHTWAVFVQHSIPNLFFCGPES